MKNKNIFILLAIVLTTYNAQAQGKTIDNGVIAWKGSKITSDSHEGTMTISKGNLQFNGSALASGSITVDMNSIVCTDLSGAYAKKLVGHLKSDDFFGVAEHPEATLEFTSPVPTQDGYKITGDFTIRGITHPETFILKLVENTATATLVIDRSKYNVKFRSGTFFENLGDKMINDELELRVSFTY